MSAPNEQFVEWLRTARKAAGMSQQNIADALKALGINLSQTQVAKIEAGARPLRLDEAVALADVFGATVDRALGLSADLDENTAQVARRSADRAVLLVKIRSLIDAEFGGAR